MRANLVLALGLAGLGAGQYSQGDIDSGKALQDLSEQALENVYARLDAGSGQCTRENVSVRKEWRTLPDEERIDFVRAVECLMDAEPLYKDVAGAKSRFDDFGVLHQKLTLFVHNSASFLLFHRQYIWAYEKALREECDYKGAFPYWDWSADANDVDSSPLFDGSPTSLGSNGAFTPGGGGFGMPKGTGGGCLLSGPFSDRTVNLGPLTQPDPLAYNPRCIKRDLNTLIASQWASYRNTTDTILESPDIELFQAIIQGDNRWAEARPFGMAIHGGGHFAIGGDPGGDFMFSPLEPVFYLHHGNIDRVYWIWQNLDWENRQNIFGTGTMMNQPPSRDQTLEDSVDTMPIAEVRPFGDLLDTVGETPFCFVYQ